MYLKQLISTEQLAAATDRPLRKDGSDVMVPAVGFQTDAQTAVLCKLLHLSHLPGKRRTPLAFLCMIWLFVYVVI